VDQPNLGEGGEDAKDPWRTYIRCCRNRYRHLPSSDSRQDAPGASSETRELREGEEKRVLGRLEGRLELTEVAESTLLESLAREPERADAAETEARITPMQSPGKFGKT
jgi:hypothetical protein